MAGFYSGNFADAVLIHPLDTEDGDDVGPGVWTLKNGAAIVAENARFGNNLKCETGPKLMDSDVAIAGFDGSDGKKVLYHLFWTADSISFNRTMGGIVNSTRNINRTRIFFDVSGGGRIFLDWTRQSDLTSGDPHIRVLSAGGLISIDTSFSLVGFIDSGSIGQGKVFIDGIDRTASVTASGIFGALVGNHQHARLGNHINALDPGQFVDEFTMIQDDTFNDTKVAALVVQYNDTRGFGYRPKFTSLVAA